MKHQHKKLRNNVKTGAKMKLKVLEFVGTTLSFNKSLKPSAKGWSNPKKPTTFGPKRSCIEAITFLSSKVRKATEISSGIMITMKLSKQSSKNINQFS